MNRALPLIAGGSAISALVLAWFLVRLLKSAARSWNILDQPTDRGLHDTPTPRLGGVAIVSVTTVVYFTASVWTGTSRAVVAILALALGLGIVGLVDDVKSLPNHTRFAVQTLCAIAAIIVLRDSDSYALFLRTAAAVVALVWITGLTNAFNFMDGLDGIAGAQAIAAGAGWTVIGWLTGESHIAIIGAAIAGSCAGFVVHNWHPASIFMGDAGSTYLGFLFAVVPVSSGDSLLLGIIEGALVVWPFVFDTTLTLMRRTLHGENIFRPHRSHLYQRLVISGASVRHTAAAYAALTLPGTAAAACLRLQRFYLAAVFMALVAVAAAALYRYVVTFEQNRMRIPHGID